MFEKKVSKEEGEAIGDVVSKIIAQTQMQVKEQQAKDKEELETLKVSQETPAQPVTVVKSDEEIANERAEAAPNELDYLAGIFQKLEEITELLKDKPKPKS